MGQLRIEAVGETNVGMKRGHNEDNFGLAETQGLYVVADGMGGHASGEVASKMAVDVMVDFFEATEADPERTWPFKMDRSRGYEENRLVTAVKLANLRIFESAQRDPRQRGMGTTLTIGWLTPGWLYFGHLGDSRLYYLPHSGGMTQLTHDHSHVGWLRRKGELNERQARSHPLRNALHQALGAGHQFIDPQFGAVALSPGDRFVLCSDGLIDGLWDRQIAELIRTPTPAEALRSPAERLVVASLESSGRDNTTALELELIAPAAPARPKRTRAQPR